MSKFAYGIYHDYVPALYKRRDCSGALKASVEAVGLATLSLARSESSLLQHARRHHLAAVKEIQVSLNSPNGVNRADTLASIMLLALFAGITCDPTAARIYWTEHIKGALAVLNSRPDSLSDDPVVNVLSSHVTSCVLVDCLQSVVGPPKQTTEIKFEPRIPVNFQQKSEYVLDLLAELRHLNVSKDNVLEIIEKLNIVDSQLDDLLVILPKKHPRTIVSNGLGLDEPVYHIYPRLESVRVWNIIRLTRLTSFELRYDKMQEMRRLDVASTQALDIDVDQQEDYASTSAQLIVHDICACIPKSLRSPEFKDDRTLINWAHSLLWPLSAARASKHAPEYLRPYMDKVLQNMWDITNFPIVDYHKKTLDDEVPPQIWLVLPQFPN